MFNNQSLDYNKPPKKPLNKKMIIGSVCVAIMLLAGFFIIIFNRDDSPQASNNSVQPTTAKEKNRKFLGEKLISAFATENSQSVYELYVEDANTKVITEEAFNKYLYQIVKERVDLESCKYSNELEKDDYITEKPTKATIFICKGTNDLPNQQLEISFIEIDGVTRYRDILVKDAGNNE